MKLDSIESWIDYMLQKLLTPEDKLNLTIEKSQKRRYKKEYQKTLKSKVYHKAYCKAHREKIRQYNREYYLRRKQAK